LAGARLAPAAVGAFGVVPAVTVPAQPGPGGQTSLARLIDLAAQRLAPNIEHDAQPLKGVVTLRLSASVCDEEL
jgi:hypothetical protein